MGADIAGDLFIFGEDKMDGWYKEDRNGIDEDPLKHNEEFLKKHKEITFNDNIYCAEAIERIEKKCGCQVICNPHFNGISYYVKNEYYKDAQTVIKEVNEEEREKEERKKRLAKRKTELSKKVKQKLDEKMAKCEHPEDNELRFAEECLKTLRLKDYVPESEAEKYRQLYAKYPEYFELANWPEDLEGDAAKKYINMTLIKNI